MYEDRSVHVCEGTKKQYNCEEIYYDEEDSTWNLNLENDQYTEINYCPYCGIKLLGRQ